MKIELKLNKEQMKVIGEKGLRVGKTIVVEGVKAVVGKTAISVINAGFEKGGNLAKAKKKLSFDEVFGKAKVKTDKPKKKWFAKKQDVVAELIDEIIEEPESADDVVKVKRVK